MILSKKKCFQSSEVSHKESFMQKNGKNEIKE